MTTRCPYCQAKAYIRTHKVLSPMLRQIYYQCQNLQCGMTFRATEEIDGVLSEAYKHYVKLDLNLVAHPSG